MPSFYVLQIFLNNVMRIKAIIMEFVTFGKFVESVLEWERPLVTVVVFVAFVTLTYYFQARLPDGKM